MRSLALTPVLLLLLPNLCDAVQQKTSDFDLILRHGTVYDGTGTPPRHVDIGIRGDRIAAVGDLSRAHATSEVDANGMAVSPGFVNMLSWAPDSLYIDGRSLSDIKQGVTLEVFGEGDSMGPLTDESRKAMIAALGRSEASGRMDDTRRSARHARQARRVAEHRLVRRRDDGARARGRLRQPRAVCRRTQAYAGPGARRDERRRARRRLRTHLYAGDVRQDRRTHRADQGRGRNRRRLHLAYAQRRRSPA